MNAMRSPDSSGAFPARLYLAVLAAITLLALVPTAYLGVQGPYYMDSEKLTPITDYVSGDEVRVTDTVRMSPQMLGRTVAIATFVAEAQLTGGELSPLVSKSVNVGLHLACGLGVFLLLRVLLRRTQHRRAAPVLALITVALWIISPANMGTAFYAVQRLAQLASFFMILGLLAYTALRALDHGPLQRIFLIVAYAACFLLAFASKEIGANLVLYTIAIEFFFFGFRNRFVAPRVLTLSLIVVIAVAGIGVLIANPSFLDYSLRPFTIYERVLTQLRIIPMYMADLLLPSEHATGLYKQVEPSRGLFQPMTTFLGLFALVAYLVLVVALYRYGLKYVAFGLVFYALGHGMESTILPLELHFRHRNYLPSIGLYLAVVMTGYQIACLTDRRKLVATIGAVYLVFIAVVGYARANAWSSEVEMGAAAYRYNPEGYRSATNYAKLLARAGNVDTALQLLDSEIADHPDNDFIFRMQKLYYRCIFDRPIADTTYSGIASSHNRAPDIEVSSVLDVVVNAGFGDGHCEEVSVARLVDALGEFADAEHPVELTPWFVHYYRAKLFQLMNLTERSNTLLSDLLERGYPRAGLMLADQLLKNGREEEANAVLDRVAKDVSLDRIDRFIMGQDRLDRDVGVILEAK